MGLLLAVFVWLVVLVFSLQTQGHSWDFVFTLVKTASFLYKCSSVIPYLSTVMTDLKKSLSERNSSHSPSVLSDLISNSLHVPHVYKSLQLLPLSAI